MNIEIIAKKAFQSILRDMRRMNRKAGGTDIFAIKKDSMGAYKVSVGYGLGKGDLVMMGTPGSNGYLTRYDTRFLTICG